MPNKRTSYILEIINQKSPALFKEVSLDRSFLSKIQIVSFSDSLFDFLIKNINHTKNSQELISFLNKTKIPKEDLKQYQNRLDKLKQKIISSPSLEIFKQNIRYLKYCEMINIFLLDVLRIDTFEITVKKISALADFFIKITLDYLELTNDISVVTMGKLGGNELNYSSDIDLFFILHSKLNNSKKIVLKKIQDFIQVLHPSDENGFVFKVDLNIRPEGSSGPLFISFENLKRYFYERAKEWEFQALIKARILTNSSNLENRFNDFKKKLIYQEKNLQSKKYLESIRQMKLRIEKNLAIKKIFSLKNFNLKISSGGIRDIEFIIQFMQLQHGPFSPILNTTNTLSALKKLVSLKIIEKDDGEKLKYNYILLRRIEHFLQIEAFLPIREFPAALAKQNRLVALFNFSPHNNKINQSQLVGQLKKTIKENQSIFNKLFHWTLSFIYKIEKLISYLGGSEEQINQLREFESDYFITFNEKVILNHLHLLTSLKVDRDKVAEAEFKKKDNLCVVDIITYNVLEAFPVICGILATYGLSILTGKSYIFTPVKNKSWSINKNTLAMRNLKIIQNYNFPNLIKDVKNKKIICSLECSFISKDFAQNFSKEKLNKKLCYYFLALKTKKNQKVLEELFLETLKYNNYKKKEDYFKPIFIEVDNEYHPFYTLLNIRSEDSFLFLFQLTNSFIFQEIYIVQVKITTRENEINNIFYLTDHKGKKITDPDEILRLKNLLHLIMYFSFYMLYAPNPYLALTQFTKLINLFKNNYTKITKFILTKRKAFSEIIKVLGARENVFENFFSLNYDLIDEFNLKKKVDLDFHQGYRVFRQENPNLEEEKAINIYKNDMLFNLDINFLTRTKVNKFEDFCFNVSKLADFIIDTTFKLVIKKNLKKAPFDKIKQYSYAIIALGKWGGQEMGFASDIELLLVYGPAGENEDKEIIKSFSNFCLREIKNIIQTKKNGIFELDYSLRPEGDSSTDLAVSINKFKHYYTFEAGNINKAINFERMSLVKARIIFSNSKTLQKEVEKTIDKFVYNPKPIDYKEMEKLRKKQIETYVPIDKINLKFSLGGLVDIEYLITCLNISWGRRDTSLRKANILKSIQLLYKKNYLSERNFLFLNKSYILLRNLINALRAVRGNAKDLILPNKNSLEMEYLSRRLKNYNIITNPKELFSEIIKTMEQVNSMSEKFLKK